MSVDNSDFTFVFFKQACHANPGADKKQEGSCSYISIHLSHHTEHTSHDNHRCLYKILQTLFEHANNLYH